MENFKTVGLRISLVQPEDTKITKLSNILRVLAEKLDDTELTLDIEAHHHNVGLMLQENCTVSINGRMYHWIVNDDSGYKIIAINNYDFHF